MKNEIIVCWAVSIKRRRITFGQFVGQWWTEEWRGCTDVYGRAHSVHQLLLYTRARARARVQIYSVTRRCRWRFWMHKILILLLLFSRRKQNRNRIKERKTTDCRLVSLWDRVYECVRMSVYLMRVWMCCIVREWRFQSQHENCCKWVSDRKQ